MIKLWLLNEVHLFCHSHLFSSPITLSFSPVFMGGAAFAGNKKKNVNTKKKNRKGTDNINQSKNIDEKKKTKKF